jgi:hypothetical protein
MNPLLAESPTSPPLSGCAEKRAPSDPERFHPARSLPRSLLRDPRHFQIGALTGLLLYGVLGLDLALRPVTALVLLGTALATQALAMRFTGQRPFEARSALISGLSLCLLLRTNSLGVAAIAAVLTVGSKFVIRWRGKHVFNPTNFGIVAMLLLSDRVWVSPGQWGETAILGFLLVCAGGLVIHRAARSDTTIAFFAAALALILGRAAWLGQPVAIALHQLSSGAFLIFAFFMISDPKSTPDSRLGRILFAILVATVGTLLKVLLYRPNGLLYALAACAPLVPAIDALLPGGRYRWASPDRPELRSRRVRMNRLTAPVVAIVLALGLQAAAAQAFCGFYVAKADTKLFNQASQVALVRNGERTVLTMANDFKGDAREFGIVIPVPTFITRDQIHVADRALIDHLDAYSAPRLVEYNDPDPCHPPREPMMMAAAPGGAMQKMAAPGKKLGVHIEATYTVGEYDIVILSAEESGGLLIWLRENGYRVPDGAAKVLGSYLKQGVHFFLAKVNLKEQAQLGFTSLRPLQIAYESPRFMLPIRLGMANANGPQELYVYTLTQNGRVETTNYRTVPLPSGDAIPLFVKDDFAHFYRAMFERQVARENMHGVFTEYAWDMSWCDPRAADPLSGSELRNLGVWWADAEPAAAPRQVYLTRLHLRYDAAHFPEDLAFQETSDHENYQSRFVLQHPWTGDAVCAAATAYKHDLVARIEKEASTLANLTGWEINDIRRRMSLKAATEVTEEPWWKRLWSPGGW